ncbi:MAG: AMP-binding protein, partial [Pseudomonadota bacterium]
MLDLGASFVASVARDPGAEAIVEGDTRLSYGDWYRRVSAACQGLRDLNVLRDDRVVTALQNTTEAATLHWACQLIGAVICPVNWRATHDEMGFFIQNTDAKAVFHDASSKTAVGQRQIPVIDVDADWQGVVGSNAPDASPTAGPDDLSLIFYTSGTTGPPKGVPRRQLAERAAAVAHIAQNLMPMRDRTLGVMPLYHTMGVRSLLAMTLLNGCFVCLPRFDAAAAIRLIEQVRVGSLYLVPTLYHDLLAHPDFTDADFSATRRLGYAGAPMTDGLLARVAATFLPDSFVNHYGSSEVYTFTIEQHAARKPGSAGKAGLNQEIRVISLGSTDPDDRVGV